MEGETTAPEIKVDEIFLGDSYRKMFSFGENGDIGRNKKMSVMIFDEDDDGIEVEGIRDKDGIFEIVVPKSELRELGKGEFDVRIQLADDMNSRTVNFRKLKIK